MVVVVSAMGGVTDALIRSGQAAAAGDDQTYRAIEEEMALELARRDVDRVWSLDDVVIVTAVGAGLRSTPGIAADAVRQIHKEVILNGR